MLFFALCTVLYLLMNPWNGLENMREHNEILDQADAYIVKKYGFTEVILTKESVNSGTAELLEGESVTIEDRDSANPESVTRIVVFKKGVDEMRIVLQDVHNGAGRIIIIETRAIG